MRTRWKCVAGAVVAGALVTGCGPDPNDTVPGIAADPNSDNSVTGFELQWEVVGDHKTIKAGELTFTFTNVGTIKHELLVIRTDLPVGKIPVGADGRINEADPNSLNVGETGDLDVGKTITFKAKLEPGKYQLVCNITNHYKNGMYTAFTVD